MFPHFPFFSKFLTVIFFLFYRLLFSLSCLSCILRLILFSVSNIFSVTFSFFLPLIFSLIFTCFSYSLLSVSFFPHSLVHRLILCFLYLIHLFIFFCVCYLSLFFIHPRIVISSISHLFSVFSSILFFVYASSCSPLPFCSKFLPLDNFYFSFLLSSFYLLFVSHFSFVFCSPFSVLPIFPIEHSLTGFSFVKIMDVLSLYFSDLYLLFFFLLPSFL